MLACTIAAINPRVDRRPGLLTLGFATKAGLVPFHVWLPKAHPAAPTHASASGVGSPVPDRLPVSDGLPPDGANRR